MYKLICTDIDGTLLNKERELSGLTIQVLSEIRSKVSVVLASSRMPKAMTRFQEQLGISGSPLIAYNGGLVIKNSRVIDSKTIPTNVLELLRENEFHQKCNVSVYFEDEWYASTLDYWTKREQNNTKVEPAILPFDLVCSKFKKRSISAHKVMCMGDEITISVISQLLTERFGAQLNLYRSKPTYLEISSSETNKAIALDRLLTKKHPDIKMQDVLSFGDNYNDLELLQQSGLGIAVANGKEKVIAIADGVTESNLDDGVAKAIIKLKDKF
ncbi:MAG: Cof subfamily protein (haloacid dehalogenase superfamily) [Limisphaerales bacterium]|jgi:Cof subfamily protein (haloacid dehalogenase superfamily)